MNSEFFQPTTAVETFSVFNFAIVIGICMILGTLLLMYILERIVK